MSHGSHNHNSIERSDRAVDQPPPAKKQRAQLFTQYKDFVTIIDKLSKVFEPTLLICITWSSQGMKCDTCSADETLKSKWTKKYAEQFNYSKIKLHLNCPKHTNRFSDEHKRIHPLKAKLIAVVNNTCINTNILTKCDQIIKSVDLYM